ncbi:MAG TPA: sugar phosphate isomerase/epimerase [Candidatus Avipropionibacterium avicola]|uniref:Sugar phosphate isomerase/epimerase n=1 Tax=Candidatus Avipropionibacterium avicola TaxID=2840701 RepID=A0A9D1GVQ9_9ACTN|nr:sugar phosphate isomerase/epimerase [Candidatus Avipropionibacterium avicola]
MKFGYFTAATPDWTPDEVVTHLAAQGWDGVEWRVVDDPGADEVGFWAGNRATWPMTGLEDNIDSMRELAAQAGLEISGIGAYALCSDHENVERVLAATAAIGASQVRVRVPGVGDDEQYGQVFDASREHYRWVAERAAAHGVKALLELHHRTITASPSSAMRLLDGLDPTHVGVIHDMGNLIYEGWERPLWSAQMLGPYLAHVHVKNTVFEAAGVGDDGTLNFAPKAAALRRGQVSLRTYLAELAQAGYDGWVVCEDFSTDLPLAQRTADNLAYLKECAPHA